MPSVVGVPGFSTGLVHDPGFLSRRIKLHLDCRRSCRHDEIARRRGKVEDVIGGPAAHRVSLCHYRITSIWIVRSTSGFASSAVKVTVPAAVSHSEINPAMIDCSIFSSAVPE